MVMKMKFIGNKKGWRSTIFLTKNRKGWIQIVEAFVAVLLIAGVMLIMLNKDSFSRKDISNSVYEAELSILREIQTNNTLRAEIINAPEPLPIEWENIRFPLEVKDKITVRTPDSLYCIGKICPMNETCTLGGDKGKDVYSQSVVISSTLQAVSYRQLNIFCWAK
jgi:hypothetical protein